MKYAWIEKEKIRDICQGGDPKDCYAPSVAVHYDTLVPDEANNGDSYVNGQWTPAPKEVSQPPAVLSRTWNCDSVRASLTLADKTRWDSDATPEIITAKVEFNSSPTVAYTTELLEYLVASQSISQTSMDRVLA